MCGPAAVIGAAVLSAAGSIYGGIQANQQAKYQGKVAAQNARLANEQAADAADRGRLEAQRHWRKVAQLKGQQQASMAANGIDTSFGSAASIAEDTAMLAGEDAEQIYKGAYQEGRGYEINSANHRSEEQAQKMRGKSAMVSGIFSAASSALSGASQYSSLKAKIAPPSSGTYGWSGASSYGSTVRGYDFG